MTAAPEKAGPEDMSRVARKLAETRAQGRAALIGYLTAFDPSRRGSLERIFAACEAGLDILELGVPFSDPTADGPTIQAAMSRALTGGARPPASRRRGSLPGAWISARMPLLTRKAA